MCIKNMPMYGVIIIIFSLFSHVLIKSAADITFVPDSVAARESNGDRVTDVWGMYGEYVLIAKIIKIERDDNVAEVKRLIEQKASVNAKSAWYAGRTPLMFAANRGCIDTVKELLNAGALVNERDTFDGTALMCAASNNSEIVKKLLDAGALVNEHNRYGITALMLAAGQRRADIVCMLLDAGATVDKQDKSGMTALMKVVSGSLYKAQRESIKFLIIAGARTDLRDEQGLTVFDIALPATQKVMRKAMRKRDRLVLQRYKLVRNRLSGASAFADLVLDYEGLKELFDSLQVSASDSQCGGCCLQ